MDIINIFENSFYLKNILDILYNKLYKLFNRLYIRIYNKLYKIYNNIYSKLYKRLYNILYNK